MNQSVLPLAEKQVLQGGKGYKFVFRIHFFPAIILIKYINCVKSQKSWYHDFNGIRSSTFDGLLPKSNFHTFYELPYFANV